MAESGDGGSLLQKWEQGFDGTFDFSAIDAPAVRELLEAQAARLVPLVHAEFCREAHVVEPLPGVRILIMIDTGRILAGEGEMPVNEVELELTQGSAIDLLDFAIALAQDLLLHPVDQSKIQRGQPCCG